MQARTLPLVGKMMLLVTIPKSGTNLFRVAMLNYLSALAGNTERKQHRDLTAAFPNRFQDYLDGAAVPPPGRLLLPDRYDDFTYGHSVLVFKRRDLFDGSIVCLARNPLDYLVSSYFYFYVQRGRDGVSHPRDLIDERIQAHRRLFRHQLRAERKGRAILLFYEDLFEFPTETLLRAAEFCGLPTDHAAARLAAEHASIRAARRDPADRLRYVRDGRIGQWRDWFTRRDVRRVRRMLTEVGIDPDVFRYEPSQ